MGFFFFLYFKLENKMQEELDIHRTVIGAGFQEMTLRPFLEWSANWRQYLESKHLRESGARVDAIVLV